MADYIGYLLMFLLGAGCIMIGFAFLSLAARDKLWKLVEAGIVLSVSGVILVAVAYPHL